MMEKIGIPGNSILLTILLGITASYLLYIDQYKMSYVSLQAVKSLFCDDFLRFEINFHPVQLLWKRIISMHQVSRI